MFDSHNCFAYTSDYLRALKGPSFKDTKNFHMVISDKKEIVTKRKAHPVRAERYTELDATKKKQC